MAGECKFEKNLLEVSNCQAASTTFILSIDVGGDVWRVKINSMLIILQCSTGLGERARLKKSKSYGCSNPRGGAPLTSIPKKQRA